MTQLTQLPSTEGLADDEYHIYALCYAKNSKRRIPDAFSFNGRDFHDGPMPVDYFIWIVENGPAAGHWFTIRSRRCAASVSPRPGFRTS